MWDLAVTEPEESQHRKRTESGGEPNPRRKGDGLFRTSDQITTHENLIRREFQTNHKKGNFPPWCEPPNSNPRQNYSCKQQRPRKRAENRSLADLEQYLPSKTARLRVSAPNSPSCSVNPPLLVSSTTQIKQRNGFFLQGKGFAVKGSRGNSGRPLSSSLDAW
jgi:hypothetical protein